MALSKARACAVMMPSVAPHTLRRHEQNLKKFNNYLCGLCVLCGEKFKLDWEQPRPVDRITTNAAETQGLLGSSNLHSVAL